MGSPIKRVYLDACCLIYLVEGAPVWRQSVMSHLSRLDPNAEGSLMTSRLSRLECRTKPLREQQTDRLKSYDDLLGADRFTLLEITAEVVDRATQLRANYGFKTPDALHLASAIEASADVFLTADASLTRCQELPVELLVSVSPE